MNKWYICILLLLLLAGHMHAQSLYSTDRDSLFLYSQGYVPDPALVEQFNPRAPLWLPAAEAIGLNVALGTFNSYVVDSKFAKISFKTIEKNFEEGWSTDADAMLTNMWAHPFHGSIYFNTARSNGYGYYTSLGIAALGSWQWEFFMENEPPALNDWVMTSVAGSMMGEMFYRLSNLIIDESATGWERIGREAGAGVFNPGRLFNRIIHGRVGRVTDEKLYETHPFVGELAIGGNNVAEGTDFKDGKKNTVFTMEVDYGRLFDQKESKPFDYFHFNSAFNFGGEQPAIGRFRVEGSLLANSVKVGEDSRFLWGLFQHYDYMENNVYQLGSVSVGAGIGYRTPNGKSTQFIGLLHGAALLMGGANSEYAEIAGVKVLDSVRNYNMGPGAIAKAHLILRTSFGSISLDYSFWWIHTWDGMAGDELIGMLQPRIRVQLYRKWFVGLEYLLYHRLGVYDNLPDLNHRNNEQRLFIGYAF